MAEFLVDKLYKIFDSPDNWDGYGTSKISENTKKNCYDILKLISDIGFDLPEAYPVCGGGLQFTWKINRKELELEFNEETISILKIVTEENGKESYEEIPDLKVEQIPESINWLETN